MSIADMIPGFAPTRFEYLHSDGSVTVEVIPPSFMHSKGSKTKLTVEQYKRYTKWRETGGSIQSIFPEFSPSKREALMTGLTDEDWSKL